MRRSRPVPTVALPAWGRAYTAKKLPEGRKDTGPRTSCRNRSPASAMLAVCRAAGRHAGRLAPFHGWILAGTLTTPRRIRHPWPRRRNRPRHQQSCGTPPARLRAQLDRGRRMRPLLRDAPGPGSRPGRWYGAGRNGEQPSRGSPTRCAAGDRSLLPACGPATRRI